MKMKDEKGERLNKGAFCCLFIAFGCLGIWSEPSGIDLPELKNSPQKWPPNRNTVSAAAADVDDDGDLDLVFASMITRSLVLINDGKGSFKDSGQQLPEGMHDIALGDLNRDGRCDLFFAPIRARKSSIFFGSGRGTFTESDQAVQANDVVQLVDIDHDGDLDAYLNREGIFLNDGRGHFVLSRPIANMRGFCDFDNDGFTDAVGSVRKPGQAAETVIYRNDRSGNLQYHGSAPGALMLRNLSFVDVDHDGDRDMIYLDHEAGAPSGMLMNDGTGTFSRSGQEFPSIAVASWGFIGHGDLNGDGFADIIFTARDKPACLWLNDGKGRYVDSGIRLGEGKDHEWTNCLIDDFDGDGDADVFITDRALGEHGLWLNQMKEKKARAQSD